MSGAAPAVELLQYMERILGYLVLQYLPNAISIQHIDRPRHFPHQVYILPDATN